MHFEFNIVILIHHVELESLIPFWFLACVVLHDCFELLTVVGHFGEWVHLTEGFSVTLEVSLQDLNCEATGCWSLHI